MGSFLLGCVEELVVGGAAGCSGWGEELFDGKFLECLGEALDVVDVWVGGDEGV